MWWKLRLHFPNEPRFNAENFVYQPLNLIFQAYRAIDTISLETVNQIAIPIANLGVATLSSQGVKDAKPEWFNPYPNLLQNLNEPDSQIPQYVSETYSQLCRAGKVPNWVIPYLEVD